ncbi:MAG TPA: methyltransferase domain-containing protein [Caulobacteraceae bacterium]|nr:methyltransferase domain-containing protein [Caulobacteraceae bacterium]
MSQNIYDDPVFFEGYSRMRRSREGLDGAAEWPALRALLPDLRGLKVVDLGCGMGWFCRWAREAGAAQVLGLDLSQRMLERARALTDDAGIAYASADLERLELPQGGYDLAFSSLAFHYVEDAGRLYRTIAQALVPGAPLVFSTEHPIYMAPSRPGWGSGEDGRRIWPLDSYEREGPRVTDWLAPGVVKHHRTLATTVNLLLDAGFAIERLEEFLSALDPAAHDPELHDELERPMFLLVAGRRH